MKKILLLAAAPTMAATAMAEVFPAASEIDGTDLTPAGFKFNTYENEFIGLVPGAGADWNPSAYWIRDNYIAQGKEIGDGVIFTIGPTYTGNAENTAKLQEGMKIIDLGGTTGKVLAINFAGSTFPDAYKKATGADLEIGEAPVAYPILFWVFDPKVVGHYAGSDTPNMRIRFEMSLYHNNQSTTGEWWKCYSTDDANNVRDDNTAPDILVDPAEFAYRWCEKDPSDPNDDSLWNEGENAGNGEWNPTRWLVYEFDFNLPALPDPEEADQNWGYSLRLKNEIPGGNKGEFTVLLRNVQAYAPNDANRELFVNKRSRTWNTYTVGTPAGLNSVVANGAKFTYSVNGGVATFSAPAQVYTLTGALVAEGTSVNLSKGVYVAKSGATAVKVLVK